jgi:hypothetical protein
MEIDIHDRLRDLCRGITLRLLPQDAFSRLRLDPFGEITRALIAVDPDGVEFAAFDDSREPICPICGETTKPPAEALRASLELETEKLNFGRPAWAHVECFSLCIDTGEQRGFPY